MLTRHVCMFFFPKELKHENIVGLLDFQVGFVHTSSLYQYTSAY